MAYTPTVYTNDASSPDLDPTNLNKSEQGIKLAHDIAVPVDCSSRVAEYTGDGGGATIKDRAGNGNNLTATNITYVNGKYGKEMSFNGSTSYAQASSPVIGTTGTVAIRFKRGAIGATQLLISNETFLANTGLLLYCDTSNVIQLRLGSSGGNIVLGSVPSASDYYSIIFALNGTTLLYSLNGEAWKSTTIITQVAGTLNLYLGRSAQTYGASIISHFRYDSRIWTADEARAWSLNPISIDSRV